MPLGAAVYKRPDAEAFGAAGLNVTNPAQIWVH